MIRAGLSLASLTGIVSVLFVMTGSGHVSRLAAAPAASGMAAPAVAAADTVGADADAAAAAAQHQHHQQAKPSPAPGPKAPDAAVPVGSVLSMDVYAQGDTVDMLLAVQGVSASDIELRHQRSRDGAQTWSAPVTIDRGGRSFFIPKRGNDAQIAASGDTLVVSWTMKGSSKFGAGALATARSTDGGLTWQPAASPADPSGQGGQGFTDLAATPRGIFFAAWLDDREGNRGLRLARSTDGGRAWGGNVTLDAHTCECCWNTLAAFDAERIAVLYRDKGPRDMALAVSGDAGKNWAPRGVVGKFTWGFEGCPHVGGGLAQSTDGARRQWHALVWTGVEGQEGIYVLRSPDEGRTWNSPTRLGGVLGHHGAIAASGNAVTALWDAAERDAMAIYASRSSDGGATWGEPQRLSNGGSATHPILVTTSRGFVSFWTERGQDGRVTWVARPLSPNAS